MGITIKKTVKITLSLVASFLLMAMGYLFSKGASQDHTSTLSPIKDVPAAEAEGPGDSDYSGDGGDGGGGGDGPGDGCGDGGF